MDGNYEKILERLSKSSGLERDELDRRVEAKRAKLSGLISREGALQVLAAELGVSFDEEKLKIDELLTGMRKVNFCGKIIRVYPIRTFTQKNGDMGKVANLVVADETSNIKVVLWDTNHIALFESGEIKENSSIEIIGGSMRQGEVHLGSFSEIKISEEVFPSLKTDKPIKERQLKEVQVGEKINTRAFVVQSFEPRFFDANLETGKKVTEEELASGVPTEKRAILNIVLDDGTETFRAVLFHEMVQKLGVNEYSNALLMRQQIQNVLGKELFFGGNVRMNSYFNIPELIVDSVSEVDIDGLIEILK